MWRYFWRVSRGAKNRRSALAKIGSPDPDTWSKSCNGDKIPTFGSGTYYGGRERSSAAGVTGFLDQAALARSCPPDHSSVGGVLVLA